MQWSGPGPPHPTLLHSALHGPFITGKQQHCVMDMARNIEEQLLDLTRKIKKGIAAYTNRANVASQGSMPRMESTDPKQNNFVHQ